MSAWWADLTDAQVLALFGLGWMLIALVVAKITGEYIHTGEDDGSWPWCDACRSYHRRDNPTCLRKQRKES